MNKIELSDSKASASVVTNVLTDRSIAYDVHYFDASGACVLTVGCTSRAAAEALATSLNGAAWIQVQS